MKTQKIVDLEDEQAIYAKFIDDLHRFSSRRKKSAENFRTRIKKRNENRQYEQDQRSIQMTTLFENIQNLEPLIETGHDVEEDDHSLPSNQKKNLIARRYRQCIKEDYVEPIIDKNKIADDIKFILSILNQIHNIPIKWDNYLNHLKKYGNILLDLLRMIQTNYIKGRIRRLVMKFYNGLEVIMHNLNDSRELNDLKAHITML